MPTDTICWVRHQPISTDSVPSSVQIKIAWQTGTVVVLHTHTRAHTHTHTHTQSYIKSGRHRLDELYTTTNVYVFHTQQMIMLICSRSPPRWDFAFISEGRADPITRMLAVRSQSPRHRLSKCPWARYWTPPVCERCEIEIELHIDALYDCMCD